MIDWFLLKHGNTSMFKHTVKHIKTGGNMQN